MGRPGIASAAMGKRQVCMHQASTMCQVWASTSSNLLLSSSQQVDIVFPHLMEEETEV